MAIEFPRSFVHKVTQPAAGTDFTLLSNGLGTWVIRSLVFRFTTSATVADRGVRLSATDGSDTWFRTHASAVQAASLAEQYTGADYGATGALATLSQFLPFPVGGIVLPQGHTLQSGINNISAADQIDRIVAYIDEYPSGKYYRFSPQHPYSQLPQDYS